jgi:hypothetical protein
MQGFGGIALALIVMGVALGFQFAGNAKAKRVIDEWAAREGFTITGKRFLFGGGKFFWSRSKTQRVYRLTVQTGEGLPRTADIKCRSYWNGMLSEKLSVKWHDE